MEPTNHLSLWIKTTPQPDFAPVSRRDFPVVIVGGGIVGVCMAYALRSRGADVLLIEGDEVLQGVTGYTTGKLTAQHGLIYSKLEESRGLDVAKLYWETQQRAIRQVEFLSQKHGIESDLTPADSWIFSSNPENDESLEKEAATYAALNIPGRLDPNPTFLPDLRKALLMEGQRHFHPRKFLLGLLKVAQDAGVVVMTKNRVHQIDEKDGGVTLVTDQGEFSAANVVVSTHYPVHDSGLYVAKLTPNRSYAMAFRMNNMPPDGMYISHDAEPLHSWRPAFYEDEPVLIVGANQHKVGEEPAGGDPYASLEAWARSKFAVNQPVAQWSTQDNMTPDGIPFIGQSPHRARIWFATGFGGWGMTNGIAAADLLKDLMDNRPNPSSVIFDPSRFHMDMVPNLVKDNLHTAAHLVGDKLSSAPDVDLDQLKAGQGIVAEMDGDRRAIYRDPDGKVCVLNPACTHMGCQVAWNEWESTWDCPCHGSRFKATGEVIHGPATKPLEKA